MTNAVMSRRPNGTQRQYPTVGATALAPSRVPLAPAGAPVEERPRLRATPPVPVTAPRAPFVLLVLGLVIAGVVGILVLNTMIFENAFRISRLQSSQATLDRQEETLREQLASQEAPNNLAAAATKMGLVQAGAPAFIRLPDGRILGVPQPAGGAAPSAAGSSAAGSCAAGSSTAGVAGH